jgi:hypothetical protein
VLWWIAEKTGKQHACDERMTVPGQSDEQLLLDESL